MSLKILIPTDFSPQADFALILAKKLAEKVPVSVELHHIIPCKTEARLTTSGTVEVEEDAVQGYLQARAEAAEKGFKMYDLSNFEAANTSISFGPIASSIIAKAKMEGFDLIVMGTKGAFGLKELISGSETQQVVRGCNIPVLSLMCDRSDLQIDNILLLHKVTDKAARIPKAIKEIAKGFDATLHLMHNEKPEDAASEGDLNKFLSEQGMDKIKTHTYGGGITERKVLEFDQKQPMDMIVVATEGRSALSQIFRPDVAEKLVNHMHKPIITFHV
ncbi:MAG: universal stress protein [Schleiferiaceae bacterium]|nr:universal stress protein [Schleiferiaceae bacterium]